MLKYHLWKRPVTLALAFYLLFSSTGLDTVAMQDPADTLPGTEVREQLQISDEATGSDGAGPLLENQESPAESTGEELSLIHI